MYTTHLVAFTAATADGTTEGIARVGTDYDSPTWAECAEDIPGLLTITDMGIEPKYTLKYQTESGEVVKVIGSGGVERVGAVIMRCANRGTAWGIEVFDASGTEVTFNFACFA